MCSNALLSTFFKLWSLAQNEVGFAVAVLDGFEAEASYPYAAPNGGARVYAFEPGINVAVGVKLEESSSVVKFIEPANHGEDGHVSDSVIVTTDVSTLSKLTIKHGEETLELGGPVVDGVLNTNRCCRKVVCKIAGDGRSSVTPKEPVEAFHFAPWVSGHEKVVLFGNIAHYVTRLENSERRVELSVYKDWYLRVWIHFDELAAVMVIVNKRNLPSIIF